MSQVIGVTSRKDLWGLMCFSQYSLTHEVVNLDINSKMISLSAWLCWWPQQLASMTTHVDLCSVREKLWSRYTVCWLLAYLGLLKQNTHTYKKFMWSRFITYTGIAREQWTMIQGGPVVQSLGKLPRVDGISSAHALLALLPGNPEPSPAWVLPQRPPGITRLNCQRSSCCCGGPEQSLGSSGQLPLISWGCIPYIYIPSYSWEI